MHQPSGFYLSTNKTFRIFSFALVIAGLLMSLYLFYQHYLLINEANGKADICYAVFNKGCTRALASPVSVQLGLPLAGWGIIFYTALIILLFHRLNKTNELFTSLTAFSISLIGCIGSIVLLFMIWFDHSLFCPFCVIIHGINLLLPFFIFKLLLQPFKISSVKKFSEIKGTAFFLLLMIILYTSMRLVLMPGKIVFDTKNFVHQFDSTLLQKIPVDSTDHVSGPVGAPLQLIVFSDFECPACRNFSKVIAQLNKKYPGKLFVAFKNFPLGKECNPIYGDYDLHPKACEAARAAEAAGMQQKFWQYHDILFSVDLTKTKDTFSSLAKKIGLDTTQFENDRKSDSVVARLAKTIDQGKQLGVKGTPAVYINGKLVSDVRPKHMQVLIDYVLKK